jgi:hypothetical protein
LPNLEILELEKLEHFLGGFNWNAELKMENFSKIK